MRLIKRSYSVFSTFGLVELGRRVREYALPPQRMTISDVTSTDAIVVRDAWLALSSLADADAMLNRDLYESYVREWQVLANELNRDSLSGIPSEYDVEARTAQLLYVIVRWRRPETILETGIARGFSSYALLSAVKANGTGTVHSCDVDVESGEFVNADLRNFWTKHVIDGRDAERSFLSVVNALNTIDFFFHDSNHRKQWMEFEFITVVPKMPSGAILGSDDVDLNQAFLSVLPACSKSVIVLDSRKASAFAVVKG